MSDIQVLDIEGVGRIKYYLLNGDEQINSCVEILSVFVEEKFRGKGFGSKLVDKLVSVCKQNNVNYIYVRVTATNDGFQKFLFKKGFKVYDKKILMIKSTKNIRLSIKKCLKMVIEK